MHTHRWVRCQGEGTCGHLLNDPHWVCGCGVATEYPPGEQHFITPERIARPQPEPPVHAEFNDHTWLRCTGCDHEVPTPQHWACRCGAVTTLHPSTFTRPDVSDADLLADKAGPIMNTDPDHEPDWVVIRPGPNLPHPMMPPELDGLWIDRALLPDAPLPPGAVARTVPAGELEASPDGRVAEVWWLEPVDPDGPDLTPER